VPIRRIYPEYLYGYVTCREIEVL